MMGKDLEQYEIWFVPGSHALYGDVALGHVDEHAREIAAALDGASEIPVRVVVKPVVISADAIRKVCAEADGTDSCVGVIVWMHTFSPAKNWIAGLGALRKPLLHLHTQYRAELPYGDIDMDYMNLHQSAHGDREFGFIATRMGIARKIVVGHWSEPVTRARIAAWSRAACGWHEAQNLNTVRFGDNMRNVAVTEGNKVGTQMQLGVAVNTHGVGDLVDSIAAVSDAEIDELIADYEASYTLVPALQSGGASRDALREAARIEAGLRSFLETGGYGAFTDTFEDLHGLRQLPGIATQRLMAEGYGFGAEGDWKTAVLLRVMKVMATGLTGGTSFMEDYTYDLAAKPPLILGAHMLEVCPSIASAKPSCEIHPLGIGGKEDPVRLVFDAATGPAIVVAVLDMGERLRFLLNEIDVVAPPQPLPKLPVARALWQPKPDFATACEAWLAAGGPHHTVFTSALDTEAIVDFATIAGVELLRIDERTTIRDFRNELNWNQAYYRLAQGF